MQVVCKTISWGDYGSAHSVPPSLGISGVDVYSVTMNLLARLPRILPLNLAVRGEQILPVDLVSYPLAWT